MKKQIVHLSVHQTSKVVATMHVLVFAILIIIHAISDYLMQGEYLYGILIMVLMPLFLWLLMYIGYAFACWLYNITVHLTGGIEFDLIDKDLMREPIVKTSSLENERTPIVEPQRANPIDKPEDLLL